jgi:hypothetical protein
MGILFDRKQPDWIGGPMGSEGLGISSLAGRNERSTDAELSNTRRL